MGGSGKDKPWLWQKAISSKKKNESGAHTTPREMKKVWISRGVGEVEEWEKEKSERK